MPEQIKQNKMGSAPMIPLIASMALPAMLSMLIQALYNIVDSIFVARFSDAALAAVSLAFPIQMFLIAIAVGTGVGLNSLISRRLGEGNHEAASDAAEHGLLLAVASGVGLAILGLLFIKPFFASFTDDPLIYSNGTAYTYIVTVLSIFIMVSIAAEKTIQGTGNMLFPMIQNLAGAITNIILDPIMIFGLFGCPQMGVAGAATATVIGQFVSMSIGLFVLLKHQKALRIDFGKFRVKKAVILDIYKIGLPAIVMQSVTSVMTAGMNAILIAYSNVAVSVLGVYFKLQSFIFMPVLGLTQGAMPVMGFNFGAQNKKRLVSAYKIAMVAAFTIMLIGTAIFQLFPSQLLRLFNDSAEMQRYGVPALRIISLSFIGASFGIVNSTVFQATGHGIASLLVSLIRQLVLILPAAWLLGRLFGVGAVWYSFPIAEYIAFLFSFLLLIRLYLGELRYLNGGEEPTR